MSSSTPRETDEYRSFTVTDQWNGQAVTDGVEVCIVALGARPTGWALAVVRSGRTTVRIAGLSRGTYDVYARLTVGEEKPVVYLGRLSIS